MEIGSSRWKCCRDLNGSVSNLRDALERFERLAAEDPRNLEARRDVGNASLKLSAVLVEGGRRDEGLSFARKAVDVIEACDRADPSNRDSAESLKVARERLASIPRDPARQDALRIGR